MENVDSLKKSQKSVTTKLYIGDYLCEFIDPVHDDYKCVVGEHVAKEPTITSCCGEVFCSACISTATENNTPCPHCNKTGFTTLLNVKLFHKIHSLSVCCVNKEVGCFWSGTLDELDGHTNVSDGDCKYMCVQCPSECGELVRKCDLDTHLTSECVKREYSCNFCGFKDTYEVVCNKHSQECKYFTVECPNGCGVTCDRLSLEDHTKECQLAEVECEFCEAGCQVKFRRQDKVMHMEANIRNHLALMGSAMVLMNRKFEMALEEKDREIKEIREFCQREVQRQGKEIFKLKVEVDECKQQIKKSGEDLTKDIRIFFFPFYFTINDFSEQKFHNNITSPVRRTHPYGYRFFLVVHPNGVGSGSGTHISLSFVPKAQDTSTVKWPARVTFTIQLLNQYRDADHITLVETLVWSAAKLASNISLTHTLVPHSNLEWNVRKQTLYLKDDCLKFCVRKVDVHSL